MRLQPFVYIAGAIIALYILRVTFIVSFVDSAMETWNYLMDYTLNLKDKQPLVFMSLPLVLLWLMKVK
jgi:hypothetical protein